MADAVRREIRRAGWGAKSSGARDGRPCRGWAGLSKRTRGSCDAALESTEADVARGRDSWSNLGVRRKLYAALPDELEAREWFCCVR